MRKLMALLAGAALLASACPASTGFAGDTGTDQVVQAIADARARANAAADALFQAESKLDQLEAAATTLQHDVAALQARVDELHRAVEAVAVNRFTRSGTSSLPLLTGFASVADQAQLEVLMGVIDETSAEDFDHLADLQGQLADRQHELDRNRADARAAQGALDQRRVQALADVAHLREVEQQRLNDAATRQAVAVREAEMRAAALARAQPTAATVPGATVPGVVASGGAGGVGAGDGGDTAPAVLAGIGGGRTGNGGAGNRPGGNAGDLGGAGWLCPVQGPVAFGNTWGEPRSGGRRHEGVDMIGDRGLPLVAVVDGFAQQGFNELGGNTVSLTGADGNRYYYAHLDTYAATGQVSAGTVVGYLGDTGNAKFSIPHLHFEIHPGGGAAVNPYASVLAHC